MNKFEQPTPQNESLDQIFSDQEKENVGNKREVYKVKGKEGIDFFVKERQSDEELQALKFLSETGVSEKLLMYDEQQLVLKKIDGGYSQDYIDELKKDHPDTITESETVTPQIGSKFNITGWTKSYLPESALIEDEKIRKFYVDYVSKLLFLILTGVLHKDLKIDNIFVDKDGAVKFIDFGEVAIVDDGSEIESMTSTAIADLSKGLELMQALNPAYKEISQGIQKNEKVRTAIRDLYIQYQQEKTALSNRPDTLVKLLEDKKLTGLLAEIGLPQELLPDLEHKLKSIG